MSAFRAYRAVSLAMAVVRTVALLVALVLLAVIAADVHALATRPVPPPLPVGGPTPVGMPTPMPDCSTAGGPGSFCFVDLPDGTEWVFTSAQDGSVEFFRQDWISGTGPDS